MPRDKGNMLKLKIFFWLIPLVAAVYAVLCESNVIPAAWLTLDADGQYAADVFSFVTAIGGTFFALRLPVFAKVKIRLAVASEERAMGVYLRMSLLRLLVVAIGVWGNLVLYYITSFFPTPKYCMLIALLALFFCYPSHNAFKALRAGDDTSNGMAA